MQKTLEQKVWKYCENNHMLSKGDRVVAGVSGGADSVCLLMLLLQFRDKLGLNLHVVHVNHGIRKEACEDAVYVQQLCEKHQVPFYLCEADIPKLAKEWGCGEEEAGRKVRYREFDRVCKAENCNKIAVAHNANDRAETMLFHLFRGTGLTGLTGIMPVREQIIRPILCLERSEIEEYLKLGQIAYKHDYTNDLDEYTRNKIRHNVLAYAEKEIVQGAVANMSRSADILAETENYIEEQVRKAYIDCVEVQSGNCFIVQRDVFLKEHVLIQKRLLLYLLNELSPMHKDIGAVHVEDTLRLFEKEGNRCIHLPYRLRARRQYNIVVLEWETIQEKNVDEPIIVEKERLLRGELEISLGQGKMLRFQVIDAAKDCINCKDIPENQCTKWLDYDKIIECLVLRTRQTGDYFCIQSNGKLHHKKLKDYMIAEKIPAREREQMLLLAEGNHVLWVLGHRISEYYKIDASTKRILQMELFVRI